jgi:hypothetical protein
MAPVAPTLPSFEGCARAVAALKRRRILANRAQAWLSLRVIATLLDPPSRH